VKINTKFLNEAKEFESKWIKSGLLDGIKDEFSRKTTAAMLECQRLHNETGTWEKEKKEQMVEVIEIGNHRDVPDKDSFYIGLAFFIAGRSKDPSTQVGAIIIDPQNEPLGVGYNGAPRNFNDREIPWGRPHKYFYIKHAEVNAIRHARSKNIEGSTMYVTAMPCDRCMLEIVDYGISRVVYVPRKNNDPSSSLHDPNKHALSYDLAKMGGIEFIEFKGDLNWINNIVQGLKTQGLINEELMD